MTSVELPEAAKSIRWLSRVDALTQRVGDWFNPILIKEARQALKSRQFVITFSLLLVAAWGWTVAAILMLMPRIYYVPSGQTLLTGYYLVLAVPMLLVVPLAAHRSLASELDDGTLDLLTVTNLSPMQIITGKLASAALQMMLYFVALFPCVAFCYVLRGIALPSIVGLMGLTISVGILLTVVGLFLAALPKGRAGQMGMLVAMLAIVLITEVFYGYFALEIIRGWVFGEMTGRFFVESALGIALTVTAVMVLLRAAAAELAPPSENRSTPIRLALLWHHVALVALATYLLVAFGGNADASLGLLYYVAAFWTIIGGLLVGESGVLTPRVRRELPGSFIERALFTWLTPGAGTGLVFAGTVFASFCLSMLVARAVSDASPGTSFVRNTIDPLGHMMTLSGYMLLFLCLTRVAMALIHRRTPTHPSVALAVLVIVAGALSVVPYSLALWWNEYRSIDWNVFQITNWIWTIGLMLDGNSLGNGAILLIFTLGVVAWGINLVSLGPRVMPLRVATPERVLEEERKAHWADPLQEPEIDPLAP